MIVFGAILCDPGYYEVKTYTGPGVAVHVARSKGDCEPVIKLAQERLVNALQSAKEILPTMQCEEVSEHCRSILQCATTLPNRIHTDAFSISHFIEERNDICQ